MKCPILKGFQYGQKREGPFDNPPKLEERGLEDILCVNSAYLVETDSGENELESSLNYPRAGTLKKCHPSLKKV